MSIASAISALSPNLWYKLDSDTGSTVVNSGSLSNNGSLSGSYDFLSPGPELGTHGLRLYSTGQCVSAAMDLAGLANVTLAMWVSCDATGTTSTNYPVLGIGDVANRMARGPLIYENHSTVGQPQFWGRWAADLGLGVTLTEPRKFWHWIAWTWTTGTSNAKSYLDGQLISTRTTSGIVAALNTDPLLLRSDEPMVVTHACFWNRVLSATELLSVASEIAPWPYTVPINQPPDGGGGGGGLTPAQDTTLTEIDTKTDDIPGLVAASTYISDTVNVINGYVQDTNTRVQELQTQVASLQGAVDGILASIGAELEAKVDEIRTGITKNLVTAEGSILSSAVGGLIAHPDPAYLHETATSFTLSGRGIADPPGPLGFANVYGIRWRATTIPTQAGLRDGTVREFIHRLVQFALWYPDSTTLDNDVWDVHDSRFEEYTWLWQRYHPWEIRYDVCPGFVLTCHWILWSPIVTP